MKNRTWAEFVENFKMSSTLFNKLKNVENKFDFFFDFVVKIDHLLEKVDFLSVHEKTFNSCLRPDIKL